MEATQQLISMIMAEDARSSGRDKDKLKELRAERAANKRRALAKKEEKKEAARKANNALGV